MVKTNVYSLAENIENPKVGLHSTVLQSFPFNTAHAIFVQATP